MAWPTSRAREHQPSTLRRGTRTLPARPRCLPPRSADQLASLSSHARRFRSCPLQRGVLSFWAPTLRNTTQSLVCRVGPTLPAVVYSCGGAGAGAHRAPPTFVHLAFIFTMYRLRLPARPRTPCSRRRPPIPRAHGPESRSRRPHHPLSRRSPHSCAYACPPESRSTRA
ncbi:hypothetical protein DFH08DRAFT_424078 [Mycena albidolilacea]|uniref:Uncharacterized protein n=1 Tax=Mycena albidolilacea TaxID=1033008 RepID=A0AAD6ZBP7_9AGAR|nr:hypothetical protein DFH08DRAFT_424078 [Mycena albidolilacea]